MKSLLPLLLMGCPASPTPTDPTDVPPTETDDPGPQPYSDPISVPTDSLFDVSSFQGGCEACHRDHAAEWETSMHAYAMVDPVYRALVQQRNIDLNALQDNFCTQCHSPITTRSGELGPSVDFSTLSSTALEGINCETCHKVAEIVRDHNAGFVLDPDGPVRGVTARQSSLHQTEAFPELATPAFCGSCHDVIESNGLPLERPFEEWLESSANPDGPTCQDCHMPARSAPIVQGGEDSEFHSHRFLGVDLPHVEGFVDEATRAEMEHDIQALLSTAASIEVDVPDAAPDTVSSAVVTVDNLIPGHAFPTGSTFLRQVWVEVIATYDGVPIYQTGTLDSMGDLRDHWSTQDPYGDDDLLTLTSEFTEPGGDLTLFSWRATEHTSRALSPGYQRTWTLFLPVPAGPGELEVTARLLFRPFAPYLLRTLGLPDIADELPIYVVDASTWTATL